MKISTMSRTCVICKDIVDDRYVIEVKDTKINNSLKSYVCRYCYNKLIQSHYNEGFFKISRFLAWVKDRKDRFRMF